jgi:hypothetical protein
MLAFLPLPRPDSEKAGVASIAGFAYGNAVLATSKAAGALNSQWEEIKTNQNKSNPKLHDIRINRINQ